MTKRLQTIGLLCLLLIVAMTTKAQDVTAVWNFGNDNPSTIATEALGVQSETTDIASTVSGISMHVDATTGKLNYRSANGDAQFTTGAKLQIPVKSTKDTVTVISNSKYYFYTIGGDAATAITTKHRATSAEVTQGYVEIVSTGSAYLKSIQVVQVSMIQEKELYATDFSDWTAIDRKLTTVTTNAVTTKYSHENVTFSLCGVGVYPTESKTAGTNTYTGFMQSAKYTGEVAVLPYVETTAFASLTKIKFKQFATGTKRGWQVLAKGDGDADWVSIYNKSIVTSTGEELTIDINKTNCQLRFQNCDNEGSNVNNNAYMDYLDIYGKVDLSKSPTLGSFKANGTSYAASDIFTEQADGSQAATIELSKSATMISASNQLTDVTADNGDITSTTYTTNEAGTETTATIVVSANSTTLTYNAKFVYKPDYTLTYYNTDGTTVLGTQKVEKDATIATFAKTVDDVTVATGKKFRGWFAQATGGEKFTTAKGITADLSLYAVATDIETASTSVRYHYDLNNTYFYPEDHECLTFVGSGKFHDAQHGWIFGASDVVKVKVGGNAYIAMSLCQYNVAGGTITLKDSKGNTIGSVNAKPSTDGGSSAIKYTGDADELSICFDGTTYLHTLTIDNVADGSVTTNTAGYYMVKPGDAVSFQKVLEVVNAVNSASDAARTYIYVPDGTYDLGTAVLTNISGNNISIIGQSMDKTIIKNTPTVEGIGVTATFLVTGSGTYMQDLTIQDALDYYSSSTAGRAVCLQDRGTKTICKNVRMLSYQDTYYSNNNSGQYYFETSDIHGCVDFICGGGDAFFNKCTLTLESKAKGEKKGEATITAPATTGSDWGYVFDGCTIVNNAETFNLGRAWGGTPRCQYLNTIMMQPTEINGTRFLTAGMNVYADRFLEYNSVDANGTVVSPASNSLTFTLGTTSKTFETITTADQAAGYTLDKVFTSWTPATDAAQLTVSNAKIANGNLTWDATTGATAYGIFVDGSLSDIVSSSTQTYTLPTEAKALDAAATTKVYTVRAANAMGGFGEAATAQDATGINQVKADDIVSSKYFNMQGAQVDGSYDGVVIKVNTMKDGSKMISKIIK